MSKKILAVLGARDDHQIKLDHWDSETGALRVQFEGSHNLLDKIDRRGMEIQQVILGGASPRPIKQVPRADVVYNGISAADTNARVLKQCHQLIERINPRVVLNPPSKVAKTDRAAIANTLQGIDGIVMPRSVATSFDSIQSCVEKARAEQLSYPLLVRPQGAHIGQGMQRFDDEQKLLKGLHLNSVSGDYYLTEFRDYMDSDGIYWKTRLVLVNHEFIPRHSIPSRQWMVHAESREDSTDLESAYTLREKEMAFLNGFSEALTQQQRKALIELDRRIGLDFCGIDCNFAEDGSILIFEVNPVMNYFTSDPSGKPLGGHYAYLDERVAAVRKAIRRAFLSA